MRSYDRMGAAAAVLLLGAALVRLAMPTAMVDAVPPAIPALPATEPTARSGEGAARVALGGNVFSVSRTAPAARFRLGREDSEEFDGAPDAGYSPEPAYAYEPPPPPPPQFRVAGTVLDGAGGVALIAADPQARSPQVYRVGDAVGAYRLEQVAYDHVVLVGAGGELRVEVARPGQARDVAAAQGQFQGPVPNAAPTETPMHMRARSSANTPPGAIPPGW
jgi:hypothetical protein